MKRTKLKRKSKSELRKTIDLADSALQDWHRREYKGMACESCGLPFELMHHWIEKSRSTYLRFEKKNLIFLCHKCHALHHQFHDSRVMMRVLAKRGMKWLRWILKHSQIHKSLTLELAQKELKKWT